MRTLTDNTMTVRNAKIDYIPEYAKIRNTKI